MKLIINLFAYFHILDLQRVKRNPQIFLTNQLINQSSNSLINFNLQSWINIRIPADV